jgi:hypothetical protein
MSEPETRQESADSSPAVRLSPLQARAMKALGAQGRVMWSTRLEDGEDPPWIVSSTVRALERKGLVEVDRRERLRVRSGDAVFHSPMVWEMTLTDTGRQWLITQGFTSPPDLDMV